MNKLMNIIDTIKEHYKKIAITFVIAFIMGLAVNVNLMAAYVYNSFDCYKRWSSSSYSSSYDLYAGCLVTKNGTDFVPERVIREGNF